MDVFEDARRAAAPPLNEPWGTLANERYGSR